jgi:endonuclease-3
VCDASSRAVVQAIRPAGLANQKGPRIRAVLQAITKEKGSLNLRFLRRMPPEQAMAWLMRFKGVGRKTASIVLLFSLGMPAFPVDTHIYRVSGRLGLRPERASLDQTHDLLARTFPPEAYYAAHLNLIRHGREICHARKPACPECILRRLCPYGRHRIAPKPERETARG